MRLPECITANDSYGIQCAGDLPLESLILIVDNGDSILLYTCPEDKDEQAKLIARIDELFEPGACWAIVRVNEKL